ncbi:MAG: DUF262 domain-containing protein, partial [Polyangiaceae bacterium]
MKAQEITLQGLLGGAVQFVIPVFQRYYEWKKTNWSELLDDVQGLTDEDPTRRHFLGAIVTVPLNAMPGTTSRSLEATTTRATPAGRPSLILATRAKKESLTAGPS